MHAAQGESAQALEYLRRARTLLPRDDEVLLQLGLQLEGDEDLPGALEAFQKATELNPAHPGPHMRLIHLYERLGDAERAEKARADLARSKDFGKRLTAAQRRTLENARDAGALAAVAALYLEMGMSEPARGWAERALRVDPENAEARAVLEKLAAPSAGAER